MALSSILCDYNKELKLKAKEKEISKRILGLKKKNTRLDETRNAMQELSTGERVELATEDKLENRELTQTEVENFFNIAKAKQKLESYAYTTGIAAWKQESGEIHFTFDPYIRGNPKGPYMIKMKPRQGRLVMTGHNLPYAVPVRKFYGTYIEDVKSSTEHTLSTFLKSNFRCLRAFLSREDQVEELRQDVELKSYIKEIQAVNHFTCIQLVLVIRQTGEEAMSLRVTISLNYDKERERPTSIKVTTDPQDIDQESLLEQCAAFYDNPLREAVIQAF